MRLLDFRDPAMARPMKTLRRQNQNRGIDEQGKGQGNGCIGIGEAQILRPFRIGASGLACLDNAAVQKEIMRHDRGPDNPHR